MEPYVQLTLVSSLLFAGGNVLLKRGVPSSIGSIAVATLLRRPHVFVGALFRNPFWATGFFVVLVAMALETQALGGGDVSVVKPLSRVQGVFVLLIAVGFLHERLHPLEWGGAVVVALGGVLLAQEPRDSLFFAPTTATSLAAAVAVALIVASLVVLSDRKRRWFPGGLGLGLASGLLFGLGDVLMKTGTEIARDPSGQFDLTSAQGLQSLLGASEFYLSFVSTACAFLIQQAAYSRGRISLIFPMNAAGGMIVVLLLGALLLREPLSTTRLTSIAVVVAGTLLLAVPIRSALPGSKRRNTPVEGGS